MILSHRDWPQVARHVRTLTSLDPSATFVISHDSRDAEGVKALTMLAGDVTVLAHEGGRADFSALERWQACFASLREQPVDYVILISGQDYVATHPDKFKEDLARADGHFEYFDVLNPLDTPWGVAEGRSRYFFAWRAVARISDAWARRLRILHGLNWFQPWLRVNVAYGAVRLGKRAVGPPSPYRVFGGSAYHALSWRAAQAVDRAMTTRADLLEWCRRSLASDEAFIQTILVNDASLNLAQGSQRYYDFSDAVFGHPKILGVEDLDQIINSGAWFARKLDWRTSQPLMDALDQRLGVVPPTLGQS